MNNQAVHGQTTGQCCSSLRTPKAAFCDGEEVKQVGLSSPVFQIFDEPPLRTLVYTGLQGKKDGGKAVAGARGH